MTGRTSRRRLLGAAAAVALAPRWARAQDANGSRVETLLAAMTLAEKLGQLAMVTAGPFQKRFIAPRRLVAACSTGRPP